MREEDGIGVGFRRVGTLALYMIPAVLGAGAFIWLGFFMGAHEWFNTLSQEQRRAIYVGAEHRPKSKMEIVTSSSGCVSIDRVDLDGSVAAVYFHNSCEKTIHFIQIHWQLFSPDGTAMSGESAYASSLRGPDGLDPGVKGEVVFDGYYEIKIENRASIIRFSGSSN